MHMLTNIFTHALGGFFVLQIVIKTNIKEKHLLTGGLWWALVLVGLLFARSEADSIEN